MNLSPEAQFHLLFVIACVAGALALYLSYRHQTLLNIEPGTYTPKQFWQLAMVSISMLMLVMVVFAALVRMTDIRPVTTGWELHNLEYKRGP